MIFYKSTCFRPSKALQRANFAKNYQANHLCQTDCLTTCTAATIGATIGDSIKLRGDKKTALAGAGIGVAMSAIGVAGTVLGGVLGKMIGGLFDIQATKENMAQADGEAALKEKNCNITA